MLYHNLMKLLLWWDMYIERGFLEWEYGSCCFPDTDLYHKLKAMLDVGMTDLDHDTFDE